MTRSIVQSHQVQKENVHMSWWHTCCHLYYFGHFHIYARCCRCHIFNLG